MQTNVSVQICAELRVRWANLNFPTRKIALYYFQSLKVLAPKCTITGYRQTNSVFFIFLGYQISGNFPRIDILLPLEVY